jgi:hypothetical protein
MATQWKQVCMQGSILSMNDKHFTHFWDENQISAYIMLNFASMVWLIEYCLTSIEWYLSYIQDENKFNII